MEPKKKIILYHLGKITPIANFDINNKEAKLCVEYLNHRLLESSSANIDKATLRDTNFYYLKGEAAREQVYYVGLKGLDNVNDDPEFMARIAEFEESHVPGEKTKRVRGGRNNSTNRHPPGN